MKSNEGIYSLGLKSSNKGGARAAQAGRTSAAVPKKFSYDSDDADDELAHSGHGDNIPTRDSWLDWRRLSHNISDSLCSWEKMEEGEAARSSSGALKVPPGADSKERPEELMSFINSFLPEGGRTSAFTKPSKLHCRPPELHRSDLEGPEELPTEAAGPPSEQAERDPRRLQAAPRRADLLSALQEPRGAKGSRSEDLSATVAAEREWPELAPEVPEPHRQGSKVVSEDADLVSGDRPTRQKARTLRTLNGLECPESQSEAQLRTSRASSSTEQPSAALSPQRRPSRGLRPSRGPPAAAAGPAGCRPLRSKGQPVPPGHPGAAAQQKASANISRQVKAPGSCSQSPKVSSSCLSSRADLRSSWSCSPRLPRSHLNYANNGEPPTRDRHCESSKGQLRAPPPPPPPGRSTSLLVRPNYEGSQPPAPAAARAPPPSYHAALSPNMQGSLPVWAQDSGGPAERSSQNLPKWPPTPQSSTLRRTPPEDYLPSAASGCPLGSDLAPPASRSVPPPYGALHGSSNPSAAAGRRANEQQTAPVSITLPLQEGARGKAEPQAGPPGWLLGSPGAKSRLPVGFKASLKSPPAQRTPPCVAAKQEKDQINAVSKLTGASDTTAACRTVQSERSRGGVQSSCLQPRPHHAPEAEDQPRRSSLLLSRSTPASTKAHLKPALGMNGAKARSQSFSSTQVEKTSTSTQDAPAKIRTQFLSSSGERGSSLSRQKSLEVPSGGLTEALVHPPRSRVTHYGGMTSSNLPHLLPEKVPSAGEGTQAKLSSSSSELQRSPGQVGPPAFGLRDVPQDPQLSRDSAGQGPEVEQSRSSRSACTIEQKVMMGIKEKAQRCEAQEKMAAWESRQKTGPSLANWFGLRRSKLPSLSTKKAEASRTKEEKKELKMGSGRKKEKKKSESQQTEAEDGANLSEINTKLSSIIDHCNNHMGQLANQIQASTAFMAKEQLVRELLGR